MLGGCRKVFSRLNNPTSPSLSPQERFFQPPGHFRGPLWIRSEQVQLCLVLGPRSWMGAPGGSQAVPAQVAKGPSTHLPPMGHPGLWGSMSPHTQQEGPWFFSLCFLMIFHLPARSPSFSRAFSFPGQSPPPSRSLGFLPYGAGASPMPTKGSPWGGPEHSPPCAVGE